MKKAYLITVVAILLSVDCNSQWYNRQYGVTDLNQLSQQQLIDALKKANDGVVFGSIVSVLSAVGIISGISIASKAGPGDLESTFGGTGLIAISGILEITGVIVIFSNMSRVTSIKKILKTTEIKLGIVNYPKSAMVEGSLPGFSITIHF